MEGIKNNISMQLDMKDFLPADEGEKQSLVVMRKSSSFFKDGLLRLSKNPIAMVSAFIIIAVMIFAFIMPSFWPYSYKEQIRESENLSPMQYSELEQERIDAGEKVFPHVLGTDSLGRDYMVRTMMGARISLLVGLIASGLILLSGSIYGACAAYFGGRTDMIMMRIVDIIYTVPDIMLIILLAVTLKEPIKALAKKFAFLSWIEVVGVPLICIFIVFSLLYWVGMARVVRSQVLIIKEQEYVTAARAMGASHKRIIGKHLLTNCIGTLIVITTLQIPSSIFTESFLSFIGLGVSAPMPSLGSMAKEALGGVRSYPVRLLVPAVLISLIILTFNLLGDGLRDAFDPKLKK